MPKRRRILSAILLVWLCVMLVTFTYTWVSRNWTPSIKGENIGIASSGALVISVLGDNYTGQHMEVPLNDIVGVSVENSFVFKQVSSQDGKTFFAKDFSPTLTNEDPFYTKITTTSVQYKRDYIEAEFCLTLDPSVDTAKYIFIHPDTMIKKALDEGDGEHDLSKAIRISLTFRKNYNTDETVTVILANLGEDNEGAFNIGTEETINELYRAVNSDTVDGMTDNDGALGLQTVYGLQYFNCGRTNYTDENEGFHDSNYRFDPDASRALFVLEPGMDNAKWITMRIWLEGQDENCEKDIAGKHFNMVLKFDSVSVDAKAE